MSSTTATAGSSMPSSLPKKCCKSGRASGVSSSLGNAPTKHCRPTKKLGHNQQTNKKVPKAKGGKPRHQPPRCKRKRKRKRQNNDCPEHSVLLHRSSLPSSQSPSGTLPEKTGWSAAEDETVLTLAYSDRIDGERVSELVDNYTGLPFSATPHSGTPERGEVEQSVIGAPPLPPSPSPPCLMQDTCLGNKPTLALETYNLPVDHLVKVHDSSSSVLYSPTQTAVSSLSSANLTLDHYQQSPLLADTMPPLSPSAIEECRKHLVPIVLASAQARDPAKRLDAEQCVRLLSDDQCKNFFRQAKEMRRQLSAWNSQKTPADQGWNGSLKRNRADDVDVWVRNTCSRFNSVNSSVSEVSRKDGDITHVDFARGRLPPKAPRAMLQASQAALGKSLNGAQGRAPYNALVPSPISEDRPASTPSLIELVHQAIRMFPMLLPTNEPEIDASNVPVGISAGDQSGHPGRVASPSYGAATSSMDFVSCLPTEPGIWFRQQGRQHAEIVDVDIDVSDKMFHMSRESVPFRLRVHLRLCSVPVNIVTENTDSVTPTSFQDINDVIERHALHWPKKGKLVVQVNPESERSKTWLPYTLESDPLDVTSCMRPGKNTFRFIQLSDLSEFTFVLAASPPPPEEAWRSWDWASLVGRSDTRSSSTDDPMNGLSELAHIPVTIRS